MSAVLSVFMLIGMPVALGLTVFAHRVIRFVQASHVLTAERIPQMLAEQIIARGMPPSGVNSP